MRLVLCSGGRCTTAPSAWPRDQSLSSMSSPLLGVRPSLDHGVPCCPPSCHPAHTPSTPSTPRPTLQRKTCFTCPSPFCLGLSPARDSDSDEEVSVRRPGAGADGFVLRTRADFQLATPRGAAVGADLVRESRRAALSSGGR